VLQPVLYRLRVLDVRLPGFQPLLLEHDKRCSVSFPSLQVHTTFWLGFKLSLSSSIFRSSVHIGPFAFSVFSPRACFAGPYPLFVGSVPSDSRSTPSAALSILLLRYSKEFDKNPPVFWFVSPLLLFEDAALAGETYPLRSLLYSIPFFLSLRTEPTSFQ